MDGATPVHTELSLNEIEAQITELAGQLRQQEHASYHSDDDGGLIIRASLPAIAGVTRWRGEHMDYDLGVAVLCEQAERARDVSAETSGARHHHEFQEFR
jgi:hypothetical protein